MVLFKVYEVDSYGVESRVGFKYFYDQGHKPIMIEQWKYGSRFKIEVTYQWFDSPSRDFTVKVYSQDKKAKIIDTDRETNMLFTDGRQPSEFDSDFNGVVKSCGLLKSLRNIAKRFMSQPDD